MVCTCGRMSLPFGAWASCGMTSITTSPGPARLPVMETSSVAPRPASAIAAMSSPIPLPVRALTAIGLIPVSARNAETAAASSFSRSALLSTSTTGMFRSPKSPIHSRSALGSPPAWTMTATSVRSAALRVCSSRFAPSSPVSSNPAVSMKVTAPTPGSSMLLFTVSVVVPATSDTTAVCWPVMALMSDDLPLLHRP